MANPLSIAEVIQRHSFLVVTGPDATAFNLSKVRTITRHANGKGAVLTFAPDHVITLYGNGNEEFLQAMGL